MKKSINLPTPDDVARLIRGKPSKNKVGSRAIWHRLRADELEKLDIAAERGYLLTNSKTRTALINSWFLWCKAHKKECRVIERIAGGEREFVIPGEV